jgi:hypothetical protein
MLLLPPLNWKSWPGFSDYEASTHGQVRSLDRTDRGGRVRKGAVLRTRVSNRGYELVDVTGDDGVKHTKTVHTVVLLAHAGPRQPGQVARHLDDDPLNNLWAPGDAEQVRAAGGNLVWGTPPENERDKFSERRAAGPLPKPVPPKNPKHCVRCGAEFAGNGRRCHGCVVTIGKQAAVLLQGGARLEDVAAHLEYPSIEGVHALAVRYGGYGVQRPPWSHRVMATVRDNLRETWRRPWL